MQNGGAQNGGTQNGGTQTGGELRVVWVSCARFCDLFMAEFGLSRAECMFIWSQLLTDPEARRRANNDGQIEMVSRQFWVPA